MNKLEYQAGTKGQAVQMDGPVAFVGTANELRGREWDYDLGFRDLVTATRAAREVEVDFYTDYETANALRRVADADVTYRTPGTLVAQGEWKQRAYILKSEPNDIHFGRLNTTLNVALLDGAWWRLVSKTFKAANATATQYQSATGETVSTSGAANAPLHALTVYGESVQDGTPTPDNPVPIQVVDGANLLDAINAFSKASTTYAGCTLTNNNDGTYTISGTNTQSSPWNFNSNVGSLTLQAGTYTLLGGESLSGARLDVVINNVVHNGTFTLSNVSTLTQWRVYVNANAAISGTCCPTLVNGSTGAAIPFGFIGLEVGDTVTPINLQGNVLASLPDGTQDVLHVENGSAWIEKNVGSAVIDGSNVKAKGVAQYNPNGRFEVALPGQQTVGAGDVRLNCYADRLVVSSLPVDNPSLGNAAYTYELYSSFSFAVLPYSALSASTVAAANGWFAANPVHVVYPLAAPETIDLGEVSLPIVQDGDTVRVIAAVTPTITAEWQVTPGLDYPHDYEHDYSEASAGNALESSVLIPSSVHVVIYGPAVNPYVIVGGNTYQVNVTVPAGGYLVIDGRDKTIMLTLADGTQQNAFEYGVRGSGIGGGSYVFEPLQPGSQSVAWDGSFGFDFGWYEEEGEPPWSLS